MKAWEKLTKNQKLAIPIALATATIGGYYLYEQGYFKKIKKNDKQVSK